MAKSAAKTVVPKRSSRDKVRTYRAKMRKQGMKLIQYWVPDVNSPHFKAEARRQSKIVAASPHEQEIMDFIEAVSADWGPE